MFWSLWARAVNAKYEIIRSITLSSIVLNVPFVTIHWCGCHPQTSPHYTHLFKGTFSLFPAARKPKHARSMMDGRGHWTKEQPWNEEVKSQSHNSVCISTLSRVLAGVLEPQRRTGYWSHPEDSVASVQTLPTGQGTPENLWVFSRLSAQLAVRVGWRVLLLRV